jgi:hypothetical protein
MAGGKRVKLDFKLRIGVSLIFPRELPPPVTKKESTACHPEEGARRARADRVSRPDGKRGGGDFWNPGLQRKPDATHKVLETPIGAQRIEGRSQEDRGVKRLIDSFTEGLIEKDQFTTRMARTKSRIAELDAQIHAYSGDIDQMEQLRLAAERLRELSATIGPDLADADWHRRREVIRTLVQRVEIGHENIKIVFRVLQDAGRSGPESIAVMVPR